MVKQVKQKTKTRKNIRISRFLSVFTIFSIVFSMLVVSFAPAEAQSKVVLKKSDLTFAIQKDSAPNRNDNYSYFYPDKTKQDIYLSYAGWNDPDVPENPSIEAEFDLENSSGQKGEFVSWNLKVFKTREQSAKCISEGDCAEGKTLKDSNENSDFISKDIRNVVLSADLSGFLTSADKQAIASSTLQNPFKVDYTLLALYKIKPNPRSPGVQIVTATGGTYVSVIWAKDEIKVAVPEATWTVANGSYQVNKSSDATVNLGQISVTWKDKSTGATLKDGDLVTNSEGDKITIKGFYFGIVPVDENNSTWQCDGTVNNNCSFRKRSDINSRDNPFQDPGYTIPVKDLLPRGIADNLTSLRFKIVPALNLEGYPDWYADSGSSKFFVLNFDSTAPTDGGKVSPDSTGTVTGTADAQDSNESALDNFLTGILVSIINVILVIILTVIRFILTIAKTLLVLPIIKALLSTGGSYFDASNIPTFVKIMWVYVRDFMNLFFILVMIFSAIRTILGSDKYGLGKTLPRVILMAIVVNLTLLLGEIVLYFAQVLMNFFINPDVVDNIASGMNLFGENSHSLFGLNTGDALNGTAVLGFTIIYEIGVVVVLGAMAALLLLRLLAIWVLLIVSPIAYILYISSDTEKFLGMWWDKFLRYAFFAPVMAFFLAITHKMVTSPDFMNMNAVTGAGGDITSAVITILQGVAGIGMLVITLKVASFMSVSGADMIIKKAEGVWKNGGFGKVSIKSLAKSGGKSLDTWLAKGAERKGEGKYNAFRRGASYLSIGAYKKAYEQRRHEKDREAYTVAVGERVDLLNKVYSFGKEETDYGLRAQQTKIAEEMKEIHTQSPEELIHHYEKAVEEKNGYRAAAYAQRLMKDSNFNELTNFRNVTSDQRGLQQIIEKDLVPFLGKNTAYRIGYDLSRSAEDVNHWNYAKAYESDPHTNTYNAIDLDDVVDFEVGKDETGAPVIRKLNRAQIASYAEQMKMDPQRVFRDPNRLGIGIQETTIKGLKGTFDVGWDEMGKAIWSSMPATNDARNRMNTNKRSNIMLKHSDDALLANKKLWLISADVLSQMSEQQRAQLEEVISAPVILSEDAHEKLRTGEALTEEDVEHSGWEDVRRERPDSTFSMEAVEQYIKDGRLTMEDLNDSEAKHLKESYIKYLDSKNKPIPSALSRETPQFVDHFSDQVDEDHGSGIQNREATKKAVKDATTQFHSGEIDYDKLKDAFVNAFNSANLGNQISDSLVDAISLDRLKSADQGIFNSVPGISPLIIKKAIREGIKEGLLANEKLGSSELDGSIVRKLLPYLRNTQDSGELALEIARQVNKKGKK